ncbi:MBL fold metallo-hydrolase [Luteimonas kalidii]|uniref:MBL fold metallo-hydrolase n=1 Tax=Luteimonas kalidii TaxID=3042025 RepID=A0ABT6JWP1_9GAMM|nr:MBL fold metallo-hydrolase [Luteimonas kalidii]MDH5835106.1 MBL fold metallo-hydrolase [Luteimonas kalidii]
MPVPRRSARPLRLLAALILTLGALSVTACTLSLVRTSRPLADYPASPQSVDGKFANPVPRPPMSLGRMVALFFEVTFRKPADTVPATPPVVLPLTREALAAAPDRSLFRLGHSTLLIKLRGGFWITDPVFAERASPFAWAGPKRFHAPPIALEDLPPLRGVLLSHDHYDHLDRDAVLALAARAEVFLAPLGVGDRLVAWGVPAAQVRQFDWWQETELDGLRIVATPAQHFSGRGLFDGDRTLWTSWVLIDPPAHADDAGLRLFFSGDTGYFDGFREIGRRFGPFDVTLVETGAYDRRWASVHMLPEQTVQAHADLRGGVLLPIHNGTFDLALHAWTDPFERVTALAAERGIVLATPRMGERVDLASPQPTTAWWRD